MPYRNINSCTINSTIISISSLLDSNASSMATETWFAIRFEKPILYSLNIDFLH